MKWEKEKDEYGDWHHTLVLDGCDIYASVFAVSAGVYKAEILSWNSVEMSNEKPTLKAAKRWAEKALDFAKNNP